MHRIVLALALASCTHAHTTVVANTTPAASSAPVDHAKTCREVLGNAERAFRADAPGLYAPYASLGWHELDDDDPGLAVRIRPGRSWSFGAYALGANDPPPGTLTLPALTPAWTKLAAYDAAFARTAGDQTLVVFVETERSAMPLAEHPLVLAFVSRMEAALDRCVGMPRGAAPEPNLELPAP